MFRTLLKSKIHRATVTDCELVAEERVAHQPKRVFVDAANRTRHVHSEVPVQTGGTEALTV